MSLKLILRGLEKIEGIYILMSYSHSFFHTPKQSLQMKIINNVNLTEKTSEKMLHPAKNPRR